MESLAPASLKVTVGFARDTRIKSCCCAAAGINFEGTFCSNLSVELTMKPNDEEKINKKEGRGGQ